MNFVLKVLEIWLLIAYEYFKMFVTDIRKDFFDLLQKQNERILLVTNIDVDSVCAVKILQTLLQCDNIEYTLVPIQGKSDLIKAFEDNTGEDSGVNYVVLINCGATMDLEDFLHPHKDLVIFVADSHRPIGKLLIQWKCIRLIYIYYNVKLIYRGFQRL